MKSHWYETNVVFDEEKATLFLARGMQNRPINHAQLKRLDEQEVIYACANTIKVDWNGRTIDGQHRLQWVKTRKKTVRFDVLWDAPPELAKVIDTGRGRSLSDMFYIAGIDDPTAAAVIINAVESIIKGEHVKVSIQRAEELLLFIGADELKEAIKWSKRADRCEYGTSRGLAQPRFNAALMMLLAIVYPRGLEFSRAVFTEEDALAPAGAYRARLITGKNSGTGGAGRREAAVATAAYFFDLFNRDDRLKRYAVNDGFVQTFQSDVRRWFSKEPSALAAE